MDINFNENNNQNQAIPQPDGKMHKDKHRNSKKRLLAAILAFVVLIFVVNAFILADSIHTKAITYKALGTLVEGSADDGKADRQGNLGNYNISSKKNSIVDNRDGSRTLTLELEFTNYSDKGASFNDVISVCAYQNDKEIKGGAVSYFSDDAEETTLDESDFKVRNGKSSKVILKYIVKDVAKDVNVDMSTGNHDFTYTVKLSEATFEEKTTKENKDEKKDKTETTEATEKSDKD